MSPHPYHLVCLRQGFPSPRIPVRAHFSVSLWLERLTVSDLLRLICVVPFPDCPDIENSLAHGRIQRNGSTFGSCTVFSCEPGYNLEAGQENVCCTNEGLWNGTKPQCVKGSGFVPRRRHFLCCLLECFAVVLEIEHMASDNTTVFDFSHAVPLP